MKRILLIATAVSFGITAMAQNRQMPKATAGTKAVKIKKEWTYGVDNLNITQVKSVAAKPKINAHKGGAPAVVSSISETKIGETLYDLQTNRSTNSRVIQHSNGTVSAAWTIIPPGQATTARGTGYNYYDGTTWGAWPTTRTEPLRTGFTSLFVTGAGYEGTLAHSTGSGSIGQAMSSNIRSTIGAGPWVFDTIYSNDHPVGASGINDDTWPRAAADGNTIVGLWNGSGVTTAPVHLWNGQADPLFYSRSDDNGATWNIVDSVLPPFDITNYPDGGPGGEEYNIDIRGNTIAIGVGGNWMDVALVKSTDGGMTWTKTFLTQLFTTANGCQVNGQYSPFYGTNNSLISDFDGDLVADQITSSAGDVCVRIDANGLVHVAWSIMDVIDDQTTDAATGDTIAFGSYFPGTNGIAYWNENMSAPALIGGAMDWNGSGVIEVPETDPGCVPVGGNTELSWGFYGGTGISGIPAIGFGCNSNELFIAYQAINELADTGYAKAHFQIYMQGSTDNGLTWTDPINVITKSGLIDSLSQEGVFPSLSRDNNSCCISLVYQRDYAPGHSLASTQVSGCDATNNAGTTSDIIYACVPRFDVLGISDAGNSILSSITASPNPAKDYTVINIGLASSTDLEVSIKDILGKVVFEEKSQSVAAGNHSYRVDVSKMPSGVYFYTVKTGNNTVSNKLVVQ